ncbi:MAG: hypothetical protein EXR27_07125 [Betaproteobacteria bacterium]|nr:hypothetical protein [Betaproteobacteria bacterium]
MFGVREEGLTAGSIRRLKGGRSLAIVLLDFCAWKGRLIGIQNTNRGSTRFEQALSDSKHIFFVNLEPHFVVRFLSVSTDYFGRTTMQSAATLRFAH